MEPREVKTDDNGPIEKPIPTDFQYLLASLYCYIKRFGPAFFSSVEMQTSWVEYATQSSAVSCKGVEDPIPGVQVSLFDLGVTGTQKGN